jgi:hypothetical protein
MYSVIEYEQSDGGKIHGSQRDKAGVRRFRGVQVTQQLSS